MLLLDNGLAVDDHIVSLNRNHLAGVFVNEIFNPRFQHTGGKLAANAFLQVRFVYFYFLSKTKDFYDVFIAVKTDGTQQCCYRQFLLAVDVGIHHIVDVSGKLYP